MHEFNGEAMISRARVQFSALLTILETLGGMWNISCATFGSTGLTPP
jgi:hypothetical protein